MLKDYNALIVYLKNKVGIDLTGYRREFVLRRIRAHMMSLGLKDLKEYTRIVVSNPKERSRLLDYLAINVSYFFRDPWCWQILTNKCLSELILKRRNIRVWSAGCACGEEPYTVSIIFHELLKGRIKSYNIRIYATDIDRNAIEKAKQGIYSSSSLIYVPQSIKSKYFRYVGKDKYKIVNSVKALVTFKVHNLLINLPLKGMNVILCRYVLIYINTKGRKKVLHNLVQALFDNGILMLGPSEYISHNEYGLEPVDIRARIYRKRITPSDSLPHKSGWKANTLL